MLGGSVIGCGLVHRGLSDPDAFAEKERARDREEEEAHKRREEEAARHRSDSDADELEGDASSWVYLKKVPGQDAAVQSCLVHHAGTQTDVSAFSSSMADDELVGTQATTVGDRFLGLEADQLEAADVEELLRLYKQLRSTTQGGGEGEPPPS
jgi:hypothetical protein